MRISPRGLRSKWILILLCIALFPILSSCSLFPPSHSNPTHHHTFTGRHSAHSAHTLAQTNANISCYPHTDPQAHSKIPAIPATSGESRR